MLHIWLGVLSFFFFLVKLNYEIIIFFPKVNFKLMENLPNAAGEVADNIADHSGWLNMIPVCVSSYHKVRSLHVSRSSLLSPPLVVCCVFTFPCVQLWRHSLWCTFMALFLVTDAILSSSKVTCVVLVLYMLPQYMNIKQWKILTYLFFALLIGKNSWNSKKGNVYPHLLYTHLFRIVRV